MNGWMVRTWVTAGALLALLAIGKPASASVTITINSRGTVSGGVATVSGTLTSDVGEWVALGVYLSQFTRGRGLADGINGTYGFVPAGQVTPWVLSVVSGSSVLFQVGHVDVRARANVDTDFAEVMGSAALKRH
jgi:hypothetical protein